MGKIKYIPPEWLAPEAKTYIVEVVRELNVCKNIKKVDFASLDMLSTSYSTFMRMSKKIAEEGETIINYRGDPVKHPAVNIQRESLAQAMRIITEFGLTPKSRESLFSATDGASEDSVLEQFMNKKR